jgi:hypothetical protein
MSTRSRGGRRRRRRSLAAATQGVLGDSRRGKSWISRALRFEALEERRLLAFQPFSTPLAAVEPLGSG